MTIHSTHPFADPHRDPFRALRGRLGGVVTLWTAGGGEDRAGLTVTSLMVVNGEPGRVLGLLDPDADLTLALEETQRGVVQLLRWRHRDLAEMFAGVAPAPGGVFRHGDFADGPAGPRLADAAGWVEVRLESAVDVGWSRLVTCVVEAVELAEGPEEDADALLVHRRGRYGRA
ncbi:flavin reductase family protein [Nocardioides zeae]|uniref:Flavin reductase (DIM6/NTAB) family NADH-FMN oxidoreductase RutF n=1 Tax=Nocardioides zeae TaxID=1457234 RepID=A0AAJ1U012_9ACTN|nr:flavin reductase family protein [Nocardioides zeae]MDQ1103230.1 flavin reductase (DIM6/NTAB) family NADH-FMN oxidoreductase RutF [Nocardioides zeae]